MNSRRRLLMGGEKILYIFRQGDTSFGLPTAYITSNVEFTSSGTLKLYRRTTSTLGIINFGSLDLSKYKKLVVEFDGRGDQHEVGISHAIINSTPIISYKVDAYVETSVGFPRRETKEIAIDKSWKNNYVFAACAGKEEKLDIYNLWLEG